MFSLRTKRRVRFERTFRGDLFPIIPPPPPPRFIRQNRHERVCTSTHDIHTIPANCTGDRLQQRPKLPFFRFNRDRSAAKVAPPWGRGYLPPSVAGKKLCRAALRKRPDRARSNVRSFYIAKETQP